MGTKEIKICTVANDNHVLTERVLSPTLLAALKSLQDAL